MINICRTSLHLSFIYSLIIWLYFFGVRAHISNYERKCLRSNFCYCCCCCFCYYGMATMSCACRIIISQSPTNEQQGCSVYTQKTPISMNEFYEWLLFVHRQLRKRRTPPWMEMIQAHGGQSVNVNVCVTQIENCNVWAWKMCKYVQCIFSTAIYRHCLRLSGLSLPIFLPNSLPISLTMFSNDVPNAHFCLFFLSISTGLRTHIDCTRTRQMLCCAHSAPLPH